MKVAKEVEFDLETVCLDDHEGLFTIYCFHLVAGFSANMVVGKMVAGQFTPVWVSLLDIYGNTIDGTTLPKSIPVVINCNGQSFNATSNGHTFVLLPGLNVTTATTGILITASYGSTVVASYNATCLPGLIPYFSLVIWVCVL